MRAAILALVLVPLSASAGPMHDVVMQPPKHAAPGTKAAFTNVSRLIYLNPCMPTGCTVRPGFDDSLTDHSSIPNVQSHLNAWPHGAQAWANLVSCVKDMYAPFNIEITDVDPGTTPHFELMLGGNSTDIGVQGAGGVAPFIPCDGQLEDNVISFVFAASTSNQDFLCWAAAQETAHVFGLDHELNAKDPMTYISPPIKKVGFMNEASNCGEDTPRECWCNGTKQNSYQYLMDTFGPKELSPPSLTITAPANDAWVKPGFVVRAEAMSQLSVKSGVLRIDGADAQSVSQPPLTFTAPASIPGGDHTITVGATDSGARSFSSDIQVHVVGACQPGGSCTGDFKCLGGWCYPSSAITGGLGSECTDNASCITGSCGSDGTQNLCTAPCDPGNVCPSGFECLEAGGGGGVCWPAQPSSGGCTTSGGNGSLFPLAGLGLLAVLLRRRR